MDIVRTLKRNGSINKVFDDDDLGFNIAYDDNVEWIRERISYPCSV